MNITQAINANPDATDAEIVDIIAAAGPTYRRVPMSEITAYLLANRLTGRLELVKAEPTVPIELRAAVAEFLAGLTLFGSLDATDAGIRASAVATVGGLVQIGQMTSEQADAFGALLAEPVSVPTVEDVARARRQIIDDAFAGAFADYTMRLAAARSAFVETGTPAYPLANGDTFEGWPTLPAPPGGV